MANKRIKVVRPFLLSGKPTVLGDELELPASLVADLVCSGKAVVITVPVAVQAAEAPKVEPVKRNSFAARAARGD